MTPRQAEVLELIKARQPIQRGDIARILGISPATAGVHLSAIGEAGLARPSGRGRHTTWSTAGAKPAPALSQFAHASSIFGVGAA